MWVRNQDKSFLLKCNGIYIDTDADEYTGDYLVYTALNAGQTFILGIYKSKERSLEVLDEIEEYINIYEFKKSRKTLTYDDVVYQMPDEWLNDGTFKYYVPNRIRIFSN